MAEHLDIKGSIRQEFCLGENCPIKRVFELGQKQEGEGTLSFNDLKGLCQREGLNPSNKYYGYGLPDPELEKIEDTVFTADCKQGPIEGTNYTNCGSILAVNTPDNLLVSGMVKISQKFVQVQWKLNNP